MDGSEKSTRGRSMKIDSSVGHSSLSKISMAVFLTFLERVKQEPLTPTKYFPVSSCLSPWARRILPNLRCVQIRHYLYDLFR
jgi:hypothetical protein